MRGIAAVVRAGMKPATGVAKLGAIWLIARKVMPTPATYIARDAKVPRKFRGGGGEITGAGLISPR